MLSALHRAALTLLLVGHSLACVTGRPVDAASPTTADIVISTAESAANVGISTVLDAYEAEGLAVVAALPLTGDPAKDVAARRLAFDSIDARWAPAWEAWKKLREVNDAVLAARAAGETPDLDALAKAYCALRAALPAPARANLPALGSCS